MGAQTLLTNLPCFNLASFDITFSGATDTLMQTFSAAIQKNPYFPLESFTGSIFADPKLIGEAFGNTQCLKHLGAIYQNSYPPPLIASLAVPAIGNSRLESFDFPSQPAVWTDQTEQNAVLDAASKNICFRNYTFSSGAFTYPADFLNKLQAIVQNRLPCTPDPKCSVSAQCSGPTPPPTPAPGPSTSSSGMSIGTLLAIAILSTAAVSVGLTLLVQRVLAKLRADDPMRRPLV